MDQDLISSPYSGENHAKSDDIDGSSPDGQLVCPYCYKQCLSKQHLQRHVRCHTGEFVCHLCHATFNYKGNLNVHLKMHSGVKPFQCAKCSYITNVKANLKRHLRSVHAPS